jgi:hypothetical protein
MSVSFSRWGAERSRRTVRAARAAARTRRGHHGATMGLRGHTARAGMHPWHPCPHHRCGRQPARCLCSTPLRLPAIGVLFDFPTSPGRSPAPDLAHAHKLLVGRFVAAFSGQD